MLLVALFLVFEAYVLDSQSLMRIMKEKKKEKRTKVDVCSTSYCCNQICAKYRQIFTSRITRQKCCKKCFLVPNWTIAFIM
ncbi:HN1_G0006650.mRNA.1.CDS.1 [Saccharomyces cerevisiae]|nr:HN1_G0006650.mRNA.1.CDS.1 [Saccharomyces cerevisiae]CAI4524346.1 BAL_1a_G0028010.mRNA.1.CDS.1 [Saccharomyces cerevisiae]CAI7167206.1 BAL_1a_G0028010.mRNA.1.CDS.1 [Saccharomyces cerevisiae]